MLAYDIDLEDCLINGSTGTVVHLEMPRTSGSLHVTIYVKFDDPDAGKCHRNPCFARDEVRNCVPIIATMTTLQYCYKNRSITVQRKQLPLNIDVHQKQEKLILY